MLGQRQPFGSQRYGESHLLVLVFVSPSIVTKDSFPSGISIFSALKLGTPNLNNVDQPLQKNPRYSLVELSDPVFEVGIALEVVTIDLWAQSNNVRGTIGMDLPLAGFCRGVP